MKPKVQRGTADHLFPKQASSTITPFIGQGCTPQQTNQYHRNRIWHIQGHKTGQTNKIHQTPTRTRNKQNKRRTKKEESERTTRQNPSNNLRQKQKNKIYTGPE
jgi:hypothetical protein